MRVPAPMTTTLDDLGESHKLMSSSITRLKQIMTVLGPLGEAMSVTTSSSVQSKHGLGVTSLFKKHQE